MTNLKKETRKIKISRRYSRSVWKETISPKLVIAGAYLRKAGFIIGADVVVIVENGLITIKL